MKSIVSQNQYEIQLKDYKQFVNNRNKINLKNNDLISKAYLELTNINSDINIEIVEEKSFLYSGNVFNLLKKEDLCFSIKMTNLFINGVKIIVGEYNNEIRYSSESLLCTPKCFLAESFLKLIEN